MKLTPFGVAVRQLRLHLGLSLKSMAEFMGISSSHLSGIEFGDKRLSQKHIDSAILYFKGKATSEQIAQLRQAAEQSKDIVHTSGLKPDARGLVAAFARRLAEGHAPSDEIIKWISEPKGGRKK